MPGLLHSSVSFKFARRNLPKRCGPREGIATLVGYAVLTSTPLSPIAVPQLVWQRWQQINAFVGINRVLFPILQEQASLYKLRGLLAGSRQEIRQLLLGIFNRPWPWARKTALCFMHFQAKQWRQLT